MSGGTEVKNCYITLVNDLSDKIKEVEDTSPGLVLKDTTLSSSKAHLKNHKRKELLKKDLEKLKNEKALMQVERTQLDLKITQIKHAEAAIADSWE